MSINDLHALSDDELARRVESLAEEARDVGATLLEHLIEFEDRNLHLAAGYRSLFGYLTEVLHFAEGAAYNRMEAAQAARRFPVILALLRGGQLHLTAVRLLAPHLEDEDHLALIGGALHRSRRDVDLLLARWFPKAPVATSIRKVASGVAGGEPAALVFAVDASTTGEPAGEPTREEAGPVTSAEEGTPAGPRTRAERPTPGDPKTRDVVEPTSADAYSVRFAARSDTVEKLRRAQDLLSHAIPSGDVDAVVNRALTVLIADLERARVAAAAPARRSRGTAPESRHVPAAVQREVWQRDGGRCAFVGGDGHRCGGRRFVEIHHLKPWIVGGPPVADNLALRCRAHNQYEARVYFEPIRRAMAETQG